MIICCVKGHRENIPIDLINTLIWNDDDDKRERKKDFFFCSAEKKIIQDCRSSGKMDPC